MDTNENQNLSTTDSPEVAATPAPEVQPAAEPSQAEKLTSFIASRVKERHVVEPPQAHVFYLSPADFALVAQPGDNAVELKDADGKLYARIVPDAAQPEGEIREG